MRSDLTKPDERMAYYLSELLNDNSPIGWRAYISAARCIIEKFDLEQAVMDAKL